MCLDCEQERKVKMRPTNRLLESVSENPVSHSARPSTVMSALPTSATTAINWSRRRRILEQKRRKKSLMDESDEDSKQQLLSRLTALASSSSSSSPLLGQLSPGVISEKAISQQQRAKAHSCSNPQPSRRRFSSMSSSQLVLLVLSVLVFLSSGIMQEAAACSSRSTPKPRPPSKSAIRPNITFQTYACPPAYAAWYCLNGATCFTVKIADSLLYNCECADGYMGQRCEFKDLDGSYLPARERFVLLQGSGLTSGGQALILVILIVISLAVVSAIYSHKRNKAKMQRNNVNNCSSASTSSVIDENGLEMSSYNSRGVFDSPSIGGRSISYSISSRQRDVIRNNEDGSSWRFPFASPSNSSSCQSYRMDIDSTSNYYSPPAGGNSRQRQNILQLNSFAM